MEKTFLVHDDLAINAMKVIYNMKGWLEAKRITYTVAVANSLSAEPIPKTESQEAYEKLCELIEKYKIEDDTPKRSL